MMAPIVASSLNDFFAESPLHMIYAASLLIGVLYAGFLMFFHGIGDVLGDLDFDMDLDADVDLDLAHIDSIIDHDGVVEATGISMIAIASFITSFGAFGLVAALAGTGAIISIFAALAGGLIFGVAAQAFFLYILSPTISSEVRQAQLIGHAGEITTPVPAHGVGQIALIAEGSRVLYSARAADEGTELARGTPVRIERIVGGVAYVSALDH
jgi:membrane protein implicated in regulation of membrane protease activity